MHFDSFRRVDNIRFKILEWTGGHYRIAQTRATTHYPGPIQDIFLRLSSGRVFTEHLMQFDYFRRAGTFDYKILELAGEHCR